MVFFGGILVGFTMFFEASKMVVSWDVSNMLERSVMSDVGLTFGLVILRIILGISRGYNH